jgi:hypothetical protein
LRITCQLKTVRRLASLQLGSVWDFNGQRKAPNMAKFPEKNQLKSTFEYDKPFWGQQFFLFWGDKRGLSKINTNFVLRN